MRLHKTLIYGVSGLMSAVAAIILTARLNSAQPIAGMMYELDAIAATVIGGTSLMGGEGTLAGTLVGALIMGVLRNGLNLLGVSSFLQQIVIGAVIVGAVLVDTVLKRQSIVSREPSCDKLTLRSCIVLSLPSRAVALVQSRGAPGGAPTSPPSRSC